MLENRFASANCILAVALTANVVEAQGDGVFNEVWCVTLQQHRYHKTRAVGTPFPLILMSMSSFVPSGNREIRVARCLRGTEFEDDKTGVVNIRHHLQYHSRLGTRSHIKMDGR